MKKSYQYILLDWDGNIAKTLDVWLEAFSIVLSREGMSLSDQEIAASFGAFSTYAKDWGITDIDRVMSEADDEAQRLLPDVELYPDALTTLQKLHENIKKLALVSTSMHKNVDPILRRYNLFSIFDSVIAYDDTTKHKPDPEPLEKALATLGGTKDAAIMIGDSDKDINAASNFGIDSILFYPPEHEKFYKLDWLQSHNPTYTIDYFDQIGSIVN